MQNLNNIKNLTKDTLDIELKTILAFYKNGGWDKEFINTFEKTLLDLLSDDKNKNIDINNYYEKEKNILIEFESFLNIRNMQKQPSIKKSKIEKIFNIYSLGLIVCIVYMICLYFK